jgi:hypothetical protein
MKPNGSPKVKELYEALGNDGLKLFKGIFGNNNKRLVDMFLSHDFIYQIWPVIIKNITYKQCFKEGSPHDKIKQSYGLIVELLKQYNMECPSWWEEMNGINIQMI